jgi:hypothetical protein
MRYYAAYSGNSLLTFREDLPVPASRVKMGPKGKTSQRLRGGILKSCTVFTTVLYKRLIDRIINFGVPELFSQVQVR